MGEFQVRTFKLRLESTHHNNILPFGVNGCEVKDPKVQLKLIDNITNTLRDDLFPSKKKVILPHCSLMASLHFSAMKLQVLMILS